jgi:hypothetical protein
MAILPSSVPLAFSQRCARDSLAARKVVGDKIVTIIRT